MNKGDLVVFTGENSSPFQEREAKKVLEVGRTYTVDRVIVGNWWTHISLVGVTGKFAIEMFDRADKKLTLS